MDYYVHMGLSCVRVRKHVEYLFIAVSQSTDVGDAK